jgi:hypothetical protein
MHEPGYSLKVAIIVAMVFTWLAFITRMVVRAKTARKFWIDDWMIFLSMVRRSICL